MEISSITINNPTHDELRQIMHIGEATDIATPTAQMPQIIPTAPVQASIAPVQAPTIPVQTPAVPVQIPTAPAQTQTTPVQQAPTPTIPPTSTKTYTADELAYAARPIMDAGRTNEVLNLLHSLGANTLQELPPEKYPDFAAGLRQLGGRI